MYTARIVGVGLTEQDPLVFFTLASKSIPFREMRINNGKGKINVYAKCGYEDHPTNQDPEIDNYSCIRTGELPSQSGHYLITFNGHMCKRCEANLREGMQPLTALDLTLLDFRGASNDARIAGIATITMQGAIALYLGLHDNDRGEKRILKYPNERIDNLNNKVLFIYDRDTNFEKQCMLPAGTWSAEELARHLHQNLIGEELLYGLSTGVAIYRRGTFDLGVYNNTFTETSIERWKSLLG